MANVLDWPREYSAEVLSRVVESLRRGGLVIIPTDTVYSVIAPASAAGAVRSLRDLSDRTALALTEPAELHDWLPYLDGLAERLANHCWPGPLTLQSRAGIRAGLLARLPGEVQGLLLHEGYLSVRCSNHPIVGQLTRLAKEPLVLGELPGVARLEDLPESLKERAEVVINDGLTSLGQPASVVRVEGRRWELVQPGILSAELLADLALCRIVFVCTGNTCRSPLAMALCRRLLAEKLGCNVSDLTAQGFQVYSAGLAAIMGAEASAESVEIAQEMGADLIGHRSSPLTAELLGRADFLFAMTRGHLRLLEGLELDFGPMPRLLSPGGEDVFDPIGAATEVYRQCGQQILEYLRARLPELVEG